MPAINSPIPVVAVIDTNLMCYRQLLLGINRFALLQPGWRMTFCGSNEDYRSLIASTKAAGLILGPVRDDATSDVAKIIARVRSVVGVCGRHRDNGLPGLPEVEVDDCQVGVLAAAHFLQKGYRHFAYVDAADSRWAWDRGRGFREELGRAGHSVDVFTQRWKSVSIARDTAADDRATRLTDWLAARPKPLALFVCNDLRGREVVQTLQDRGLHVPDEVAVLGVDDDDLNTALSNPPLSSVAIPWQWLGYRAAELLHQRMAGEAVPPQVYLVPPTGVVERTSTGAVSISDPDVRQAVQFIRAHAHHPISVNEVVAAVGTLTRRGMERRFRAVLGRTPLGEIRRARFARAKLLLGGTNLPVDEVALSSGFTDPDWFTKAFRDAFGQSPAEYRRRNGDGMSSVGPAPD